MFGHARNTRSPGRASAASGLLTPSVILVGSDELEVLILVTKPPGEQNWVQRK